MGQAVAHPFEPVVSPGSHVLILGSFPSVKSREQGFYYGHPQNRFWRVLSEVYREPLPLTIPAKRELVLRHGLALWDVIASCEITGSSDASVKNAVPVNIARVMRVADIRQVLCNGALSGRLYAKYLLPVLGIEALVLPSTSPANAAWTLPKLVAAWDCALKPTTGDTDHV